MATTKELAGFTSTDWGSMIGTNIAGNWEDKTVALRQAERKLEGVEQISGDSNSPLSMLWFGVGRPTPGVLQANQPVEMMPIFEQAGIGMAILDNSFLITEANQQFAQLLKAQPHELRKCSLTEFT